MTHPEPFAFTIRGVRGGTVAIGPEYARHGGHTTCFSLHTPEGMLLIDAGTGLAAADADIDLQAVALPIVFLFTHFHLDHLTGLPFFRPLYQKGRSIRMLGDPARTDDWPGALRRFCSPPYWPVDMATAGADIRMERLPEAGSAVLLGARVAWCPVWHPQGCLAYRLDLPAASIVVATDHECGDPDLDRRFVAFCRGADALIYDAQYTPDEYPRHRGLGHSTWRDGVAIARAAGVGELILTHLDRSRTDAAQDEIVALARREFPRVRSATQGLRLP